MMPLKLLVVDDEADFAEFVADVAEDMDFDVSSTNDPNEFSSLYSSEIDIVILDLFMPDVDGIELLRYLSEHGSDASVVFMSGKDIGVLRSAQELAMEQRIDVLGTLQKPFRAEQLENVLAGFVRKSSAKISGDNELPSLAEIQQALDRDELFLMYQPQINIADRRVAGAEALIRWEHPTKGMIPPGIFIPITEESELIFPLTSFVAEAAIKQQGRWKAQGMNLQVSINMSPRTLLDLDLPEKMAAYAAENGADISNITFEVTETSATSNVAKYMDILARLRMKGFNLSIDDFGTGYSSMQQLVRVPFNELKVDQAFIRKLDTDKDCRTITEISIILAHKLGMRVVAEGIEDESAWNILHDLGCDEGQGYWMGRPMTVDDLEEWLRNWTASNLKTG